MLQQTTGRPLAGASKSRWCIHAAVGGVRAPLLCGNFKDTGVGPAARTPRIRCKKQIRKKKKPRKTAQDTPQYTYIALIFLKRGSYDTKSFSAFGRNIWHLRCTHDYFYSDCHYAARRPATAVAYAPKRKKSDETGTYVRFLPECSMYSSARQHL